MPAGNAHVGAVAITPLGHFVLLCFRRGSYSALDADYSGDSKTDELMTFFTIFRSPPRTWAHLGSQLKDKPSLGRIFRTLEICYAAFCVLVWSGHNELMCVLDCAACVFHRAWFGRNRFFLQP